MNGSDDRLAHRLWWAPMLFGFLFGCAAVFFFTDAGLVVTAIALAVFSGWQSGWILMLRENVRHARKADYVE